MEHSTLDFVDFSQNANGDNLVGGRCALLRDLQLLHGVSPHKNNDVIIYVLSHNKQYVLIFI